MAIMSKSAFVRCKVRRIAFCRLLSGIAAVALCHCAVAGETALSDSEIWNQGVDYYRAGDISNAVRVLRPMMLSRSHGARAAEVIMKIAYDNVRASTGKSAAFLDEAAAAAQIALRAMPEDARANRNFTRAVDGLLELRERERIEELVRSSQGKDIAGIIKGDLETMREALRQISAIATNDAKTAIAKSDALSKKIERAADDWIIAREVLSRSFTNEQQAVAMAEQLDQARRRTIAAAEKVGDIDTAAFGDVGIVEDDFHKIHKVVAPAPDVANESLLSQTNAYNKVEALNGRDWQNESLEWTGLFLKKFPRWAQEYEQQAATNTNMPPLTAETKDKIAYLALRVEKLQKELVAAENKTKQIEAMKLLQQMIDLLPKNPQNQSGDQNQNAGGQQNQNRQNQNKNDKSQENKEQNQEQNGEEQSDERQEDENKEEQQEQAGEQQKQDEERDNKKDKEIEAALMKAQERSDEHEDDKRRLMRQGKLPPNERDW